MAISLIFGLEAARYSIGQFSRPGPGMFPLMVSSLLFLIGVITVVRSRFVEATPLAFSLRNISIILLSLCGFALVSKFVNMIAGIVFLVFCSTLAGRTYSVVRNLKLAAGLSIVALAFQKGLGLSLPLY